MTRTSRWSTRCCGLTFNGVMIQTGTESYCLAHTKAQVDRAETS
ncbi:hypothetical protein ABT373_21095 [Streptomyces sp. NPDC000070]